MSEYARQLEAELRRLRPGHSPSSTVAALLGGGLMVLGVVLFIVYGVEVIEWVMR